MARRAASIWRAVRRPRPIALRPHSPKETFVPRVAKPSLRPLCSLRNLRRLGCNMLSTCLSYALGRRVTVCLLDSAGTRLVAFRLTRSAAGTTLVSRRLFSSRLLVTIEQVTLVNPDLDTDYAVGRQRLGSCVVDVSAQGVQRHTTFTIPLATGNFGAVQTTCAHDLDALGAKAHRVLHRTLHRSAEHDPLLELLSDGIGDQLRIDFRLADFFNRHMDGNAHDALKVRTKLFDVFALLADDHTRTGGVNGDASILGRTLDEHATNGGVSKLALQILTNLDIFLQHPRKVLAVCIPA